MADLDANDIYNYAMIMGYTYTGDRTSPPVRFFPSQSFHTSWAGSASYPDAQNLTDAMNQTMKESFVCGVRNHRVNAQDQGSTLSAKSDYAYLTGWYCPASAGSPSETCGLEPSQYSKKLCKPFMAFRGTNNMENWLTNNLSLCNMHASSIMDNGMYPADPGGSSVPKVADGFWNGGKSWCNTEDPGPGYTDIRASVQDFIEDNQDQDVLFLGHSLGGAFATFAVADAVYSSKPPKSVSSVTYNPPRSVNDVIIDKIESYSGSHNMIINDKDIVHLVPPAEPSQTRHLGNVYINRTTPTPTQIVPGDIYSCGKISSAAYPEFVGVMLNLAMRKLDSENTIFDTILYEHVFNVYGSAPGASTTDYTTKVVRTEACSPKDYSYTNPVRDSVGLGLERLLRTM